MGFAQFGRTHRLTIGAYSYRTMKVQFENVVLEVREEPAQDWLLETALVAEGYGISESSLRSAKSRNEDELVEGKHYLVLQNATSGQNRNQVFWTKKGVIRLGFFIKSDRAKKFRDWAEDLIIKTEAVAKPLSTLDFLQVALDQMKAQDVRLNSVENKVQLLEARTTTRPDSFTIMGFAILEGVHVSLSMAAQLGKRAKRLCAEKGYPVDSIADPRFGKVGVYPTPVLKEVFCSTFPA